MTAKRPWLKLPAPPRSRRHAPHLIRDEGADLLRRRSTYLRVLLVLTVTAFACVLSPGVASASGSSITISTASTAHGSFSTGSPAVFTPDGTGDAVLNVTDLQTKLSTGPVTVGDAASTSGISIDAGVSNPSSNTLTFQAPVTLGSNVTLASPGAGDITFTSTVDGAHALAVNTAGSASFQGAVGANTALTSLTTGGGGSTQLDSSVTTTGAQAFQDAVTLGSDVTLASPGAGDITFTSTVDGSHALAVNTAGSASFQGAVGSATALTSLTTDASGSTQLDSSVTTSGAQAFQDAVTLGSDVTLGSGGGITFWSTVDGAHALTVSSGGNTTLSGNVTVGSLTVTTGGGAITQTAGVLSVAGTSSLNAGSGAITLTDLNDFAGAVSVTGGSTRIADMNALTLGTVNVGALTVNAVGGALDLGSGMVDGDLAASSNGPITQSGALDVTGTSTLDAAANPITLTNAGNDFTGAVSLSNAGSSDAALATSGDLVVGSSAVGGNLLLKALGSLTVGSAATVSAGGSAVLVSDAGNPSPPAVGTSLLTVGSNAGLTTGGSLSLYAARQDQVSVGQGATLNGATYSPGTAYVDTASERWGVYYPNGAAQAPYTIFYKDQATQTITFTSSPPGQATVGDSYVPTATSSSGLPVTLTIDPSASGVCSISGTGVVTFNATGTCVVDANQAGNTGYAPAAQVQQTITVAPVPLPAPPGPSFPGPVTGWDEATSSSPTGTATVTQGCVTATATGVGTVVVANYASNPVGDPAFRPAGVWFDVQTTGSSALSRLDVSCRVPSSAAGGNTLYWWDGSSWQLVSGQSFDAATSTVTATVSETSSPALGDLTGTVFAVAVRPLVSRMAGADREHTAIEISQAVFGPAEAGAVVLARQDAYPDALVGGPLAVARHAPLLLTSRTGLDPAVAVEIQRVLAPGGTVFLLGGRASLAPTVEQALADLGYRVHRLGGATRYDTAAIVANRLPHAHRVLLATGSDFPDALTASTAAAHTGGVVLLTHDASMPARTETWLSRHPGLPVTAIGGPAATADPAAHAFVGKDRYATATLVASGLFGDPTTVGIASGQAFPDALTAVTQLGGLDAPLLLTRGDQLPSATSSWLTAHRSTLTGINLYGGTTAVDTGVESTVTDLTGGLDR